MREKTPQADIGVIVGRFQVPELHQGHKDLINEVRRRHQKVLIMLGSTPGLLVTRNNPLDYKTREKMLQQEYPDITILPIKDMPSDNDWSRVVDERIMEIFQTGSVIMYGSRDSFVPHYKGRFRTVKLESAVYMSGTEVRDMVSNDVRASSDFRRGVVYASYNRHPVTFPTVDIAIWDNDEKRILLARKKHDLGKWRFPGGFVDPRRDKTKEEAAMREAVEETGVSVHQPEYVGSALIDDWRYRAELDCIMTSLYMCQYMSGKDEAGDDVDEVKWFPIKDLKDGTVEVVKEHQCLVVMFLSHLKKEGYTR